MYTAKYQGRFYPKNTEKYAGDVNDIIYRSSWELKAMKWFDREPSILEWGSEVAVIPYKSPIDNKIHRYFVDFYVKVRTKKGNVERYLVEVKPKQFTMPPVHPGKQTRRYLQETVQYVVNEAKWKAATSFCEKKGWKFLILTEDDLLT